MNKPARSIAVYCFENERAPASHRQLARALGTALAQNGIGLVFGAMKTGLMGEVARATLGAGGYVTGVFADEFPASALMAGLSEVIHVPDRAARKKRMTLQSVASIALPGGLGTLEEIITEATTVKVAKKFNLVAPLRPIILLDDDGYWQPFIDLLLHIGASKNGTRERDFFHYTRDVRRAVQIALVPKP